MKKILLIIILIYCLPGNVFALLPRGSNITAGIGGSSTGPIPPFTAHQISFIVYVPFTAPVDSFRSYEIIADSQNDIANNAHFYQGDGVWEGGTIGKYSNGFVPLEQSGGDNYFTVTVKNMRLGILKIYFTAQSVYPETNDLTVMVFNLADVVNGHTLDRIQLTNLGTM